MKTKITSIFHCFLFRKYFSVKKFFMYFVVKCFDDNNDNKLTMKTNDKIVLNIKMKLIRRVPKN